jgi:ribosomal protein S18 acetylase RimI-like enzyme
MIENLSVDKAKREDAIDIARIIWASENTSNEVYKYAQLFDIDENEFLQRFAEVVMNEFDFHPLGYKSFQLIKLDDQIVGGFAMHYEKYENSSSLLCTGALMSVFSRSEMQKAFQMMRNFKQFHIPKTANTWQLDSVAIFPSFRGMGILKTALKSWIAKNYSDTIEVQVWKKNERAIQAYEKIGFSVFKEGQNDKTGNGRILMRYLPENL